MADMLKADLDVLHRLSSDFAGHAQKIEQIRIEPTLVMPDSPIQDLGGRVAEAVGKAYGLMAGNFHQMSEATKAAVLTYDGVDQAFAEQLRKYLSGEQGR
ncbi:hypothetical protein D5S18_11855 [Nocardia panacis]|uniref:Uncharacterized protein n=1 Tax=Nocardia panacis TaxID=2340916 RepID=A0A3A4KJR8_9NOCA|nr:hypothetical protein [Nocardia panacis]RJO76904.1 hypothetical protein D5S18_11855 [Nocardia panacis]